MPLKRIATDEFKEIMTRGKVFHSPLASLRYIVRRDDTLPAFSVVVSKKVAKTAVKRNNIRRRMYDALGVYLTCFAHPVTIVAYPTTLIIEAPFQEIQKELKKVFEGVVSF